MKQKTNLPLNVSEEYVKLFNKKVHYDTPVLEVLLLRNVFVSHAGIVLKKMTIPLKSAENLIGFYDQTFYWSHWRKAIEQLLVCKFGKSLQSIQLDKSDLYFTIHTPWFGYFSWLTTCIPKLLDVVRTYPNAILLVPQEWEKIDFVKNTLALFPDLKMKTLPSDSHAFIDHFVLAQNRPWTSVFYPKQIQEVRDVFIKESLKVTIKPIKRLYVSRKKALRRKIINELELVDFVKSKGFEEICFEDYSIIEQVFLMQNAECLISMHGAGLTNVLFMNPESSVLEITPIVERDYQFRFPFWRIASILKLNYFVQFSKTIDSGESDFYSRNIDVNLAELQCNVGLMLNDNV
jgi:hypothetical protein